MKDLDVKKKVLDEIMGLMDEKDGERLKKKSPKFMAAKIEIAKPTPKSEESMEEEESEMELGSSPEEGELDPEMMQKLLEMYEEMKG
jgi:hypothetical protein